MDYILSGAHAEESRRRRESCGEGVSRQAMRRLLLRHHPLCRPGLRYWLCVFVVLTTVYLFQLVTSQANRIVLYKGARLIPGDGS